MGASGVVADQIVIQHGLHFLNGFEPSPATLHSEVLVQQRAMEALDDAVGLWPLHPRRAVLDLLQLDGSINSPFQQDFDSMPPLGQGDDAGCGASQDFSISTNG